MGGACGLGPWAIYKTTDGSTAFFCKHCCHASDPKPDPNSDRPLGPCNLTGVGFLYEFKETIKHKGYSGTWVYSFKERCTDGWDGVSKD